VKQLIGSSGLQRIQKILGEVAAVTCELRDFLNDRQSHRHNYARIESFLLPTVPSKRALGCQTSVVRHYDPKSKILQAKPGDLVAICASERNRKGVPFFADHHPFRAEIRQIILKFGGKPAVVLDDKTPELPRHPGMRRRRLSTTHHYNGHSNSKKSSDGVTGLRGEVNGSVGDTLSGRGKERELATISDDTKSDKKGLGLTSNKKVNFRRRRSSVSMLKELFEPDGKNVAPIASSLQLNATSIPWIPVRILHRSPGSWSKSEIKRMSVDGQTAKPSESQLWVPRMLLRRITSAPVHHAQPPANCQGCIAIFVETVRSVSKCPELIALREDSRSWVRDKFDNAVAAIATGPVMKSIKANLDRAIHLLKCDLKGEVFPSEVNVRDVQARAMKRGITGEPALSVLQSAVSAITGLRSLIESECNLMMSWCSGARRAISRARATRHLYKPVWAGNVRQGVLETDRASGDYTIPARHLDGKQM